VVGGKHPTHIVEVDINNRGLLEEIALNYNSPLDGLLVHCWYPPEPDFLRVLYLSTVLMTAEEKDSMSTGLFNNSNEGVP